MPDTPPPDAATHRCEHCGQNIGAPSTPHSCYAPLALPTRTPTPTREEVVDRIGQYLELGGLFNPELMDHDRVRALIIDARAALGRTPDPWAEADAAHFREQADLNDSIGLDDYAARYRRAAQRARGVPVTEDGR